MRTQDDSGVAAVVGAVVVLALLGIALLYVNAFHVPAQGEALEVAAAERVEAALAGLAATLSGAPQGLVGAEIPLRPDSGTPPLLGGVVLRPVRSEGGLALGAGSNVTVSVLVAAPVGGVPAGDPTRVAEGGKMRVYLLGNASAGVGLGSLRATTGGAYLAPAERVLEGGAVLADTPAGSLAVAPPALVVSASGGTTRVSWRLPLLAGAPTEVVGTSAASVTLVPGPGATLGGPTDEVRLRIETPRLTAWQTILAQLVGPAGSVTATSVAPDRGFVDAVVPSASLVLQPVRYEVSLAERVA